MDRNKKYNLDKAILLAERMGLRKTTELLEASKPDFLDDAEDGEEDEEESMDENQDHSGESCEEAHPDQSHEEYMEKKEVKESLTKQTIKNVLLRLQEEGVNIPRKKNLTEGQLRLAIRKALKEGMLDRFLKKNKKNLSQ